MARRAATVAEKRPTRRPRGRDEGLISVRTRAAVAGVAALALALSGCGSKAKSGGSTAGTSSASGATSASGSSSTASGGALNACMVLDTGGIDDHSFNETSYAGMKAAAAANPNIKISYIPSNSGNDYTPNLNTEVGKKCDPIIAVGGLMAANVKTAATANPNVHFAEVDNPSEASNMYGMQFNTAQGAFLGGMLAAGMSKSGVVGTWGGAKIGPVTIYMDGFWEGVQYYNAQNHKNVRVLGWNEKNQSGGTFVPGNNPFGDPNDGKSISQSMINQGADVLFPVAGGSGLGAGAAAAASGGRVSVIWVDTDGCISAAQYCKFFLTSVTKGLSQAVQAYLDQAAKGAYPTGSYIGTLANNGTGLAPYHDFQSKVPASLTAQINQAKADIISGKIKITSPSQPKA
jgi:basic membrane protein A